jgi:hypothetical protein
VVVIGGAFDACPFASLQFENGNHHLEIDGPFLLVGYFGQSSAVAIPACIVEIGSFGLSPGRLEWITFEEGSQLGRISWYWRRAASMLIVVLCIVVFVPKVGFGL